MKRSFVVEGKAEREAVLFSPEVLAGLGEWSLLTESRLCLNIQTPAEQLLRLCAATSAAVPLVTLSTWVSMPGEGFPWVGLVLGCAVTGALVLLNIFFEVDLILDLDQGLLFKRRRFGPLQQLSSLRSLKEARALVSARWYTKSNASWCWLESLFLVFSQASSSPAARASTIFLQVTDWHPQGTKDLAVIGNLVGESLEIPILRAWKGGGGGSGHVRNEVQRAQGLADPDARFAHVAAPMAGEGWEFLRDRMWGIRQNTMGAAWVIVACLFLGLLAGLPLVWAAIDGLRAVPRQVWLLGACGLIGSLSLGYWYPTFVKEYLALDLAGRTVGKATRNGTRLGYVPATSLERISSCDLFRNVQEKGTMFGIVLTTTDGRTIRLDEAVDDEGPALFRLDLLRAFCTQPQKSVPDEE